MISYNHKNRVGQMSVGQMAFDPKAWSLLELEWVILKWQRSGKILVQCLLVKNNLSERTFGWHIFLVTQLWYYWFTNVSFCVDQMSVGQIVFDPKAWSLLELEWVILKRQRSSKILVRRLLVKNNLSRKTFGQHIFLVTQLWFHWLKMSLCVPTKCQLDK